MLELAELGFFCVMTRSNKAMMARAANPLRVAPQLIYDTGPPMWQRRATTCYHVRAGASGRARFDAHDSGTPAGGAQCHWCLRVWTQTRQSRSLARRIVFVVSTKTARLDVIELNTRGGGSSR